uniref:Uncharacterized protein n=1 Tax=Plectus sambesii TaxID=2011161 RepID=A0A914UIM6_9BILA
MNLLVVIASDVGARQINCCTYMGKRASVGRRILGIRLGGSDGDDDRGVAVGSADIVHSFGLHAHYSRVANRQRLVYWDRRRTIGHRQWMIIACWLTTTSPCLCHPRQRSIGHFAPPTPNIAAHE